MSIISKREERSAKRIFGAYMLLNLNKIRFRTVKDQFEGKSDG
jgi:hypothetical protein